MDGIWIRHQNGRAVSLVHRLVMHEDGGIEREARLVGDDGIILGTYDSLSQAEKMLEFIMNAIERGRSLVDLTKPRREVA